MIESLDNKLLEGGTQNFDLYAKDHGYKITSRYIRVLFKSQNINILDISEVSQ